MNYTRGREQTKCKQTSRTSYIFLLPQTFLLATRGSLRGPFYIKLVFFILLDHSVLDLPPILLNYSYVTVARGTRVMFHSDRVFISLSASVFSIFTASDICRSIASFLYVPVTFIVNSCISPLWTSKQCRQSGEFLSSCLFKFLVCSSPLVYALVAVSPL